LRASKFQPPDPGVRQVTATRPGSVAVFWLDLVEEFRANDRSLGTVTFILGDQMKTLFAGLAFVLALTACENRTDRDTGRVEGADTSVTTRTTQDTTIVTADTTVDVDVDTTVKEGDVKRSGTSRDTARTH
jgi:hypothetical protein